MSDRNTKKPIRSKAQNEFQSTLLLELRGVLDGFEKATGLQVCTRSMSDRWRDVDGQSVFPGEFQLHRSELCNRVKEKEMDRCKRCDSYGLAKDCQDRQSPFVRMCHAGVEEVLVPLWIDGVLVAVLFVGQFVRKPTLPIYGVAPRRISAPDVERVRALTLALQSYFLDVLRRVDRRKQSESLGRRGIVERYIRQSLAQGPTIQGLAKQLALSPSRTSHVVREVTGIPFQQVVESRRITIAKDLLTASNGKIAWVSAQSGFKDAAYFCRYFKTKTGTTPTAYRKRQQKADQRV